MARVIAIETWVEFKKVLEWWWFLTTSMYLVLLFSILEMFYAQQFKKRIKSVS